MNKMIEQVSIALYAADGMPLAIYPPKESWLKDRESVRERFRRLARTAIKAMREPIIEIPRQTANLYGAYASQERRPME